MIWRDNAPKSGAPVVLQGANWQPWQGNYSPGIRLTFATCPPSRDDYISSLERLYNSRDISLPLIAIKCKAARERRHVTLAALFACWQSFSLSLLTLHDRATIRVNHTVSFCLVNSLSLGPLHLTIRQLVCLPCGQSSAPLDPSLSLTNNPD